jgi:hypothetical protein
MTTIDTVNDLRRELEKARHALIDTQTHLAAHAEANAALHCATAVMYSPLHAKVTAAIRQIEHALLRTEGALTAPLSEEQRRAQALASVLLDLDRCEHGRHSADNCFGCPHGQSTGNLQFPPGTVLGHGLRGPIVVPPNTDRHDPAAWRPRTRAEVDPS